jgi:predicted RNA-binding Zn-ribbon protein involved in translation (DUF1610 family)
MLHLVDRYIRTDGQNLVEQAACLSYGQTLRKWEAEAKFPFLTLPQCSHYHRTERFGNVTVARNIRCRSVGYQYLIPLQWQWADARLPEVRRSDFT